MWFDFIGPQHRDRRREERLEAAIYETVFLTILIATLAGAVAAVALLTFTWHVWLQLLTVAIVVGFSYHHRRKPSDTPPSDTPPSDTPPLPRAVPYRDWLLADDLPPSAKPDKTES